MGWCSGTEVFDNVAKFVLKSNLPDRDKEDCLTALAEALEEQDWDCQNDSEFWEHPIVRNIMKELHPDWDWDE